MNNQGRLQFSTQLLSTLFLALTLFSVGTQATTDSGTLSTAQSNYSTDDLISISYRDSGADDDWIGIFPAGEIGSSCESNSRYVTWQYAESVAGSVSFGDLPPGDYQAQLFAENRYCHIGSPIAFSIGSDSGGTDGDILSSDKTSYTTSDSISITYTNSNASDDWVGVYKAGELGNSCDSNSRYITWEYADRSSGSVRFDNLDAGNYQIQLFADNGYCHVGNPISIEVVGDSGDNNDAEISTAKATYSEGESVSVTYSNSGSSLDWIGVYPAGEVGSSCQSNSNDVAWKYTENSSGTVSFSGLSAGDYDLQFFADDGYCYLGSPVSITVEGDNTGGGSGSATISTAKSSYTVGETISVAYSNSESSQDWVGVYPAGQVGSSCQSNSNYLTWKYTESSSGNVSFSDLSAGSYELQLFDDNGYCHLGESIAITVASSGGGGNNGGDVSVTINPYRNVNWSSYEQYKANFHTHTTQSDGDLRPARVIDRYHEAGYKILSITDHDTITWPWGNYGRSPNNLGMLAVRGDEYSNSHHVNVFYDFSRASSSLESGIPHVQNSGGLCQINHPRRYSSASDWDWYLDWYKNYPACIGIEVVNRNTRFPELWDNINQRFFEQDRKMVWGFANDDMHDTSELYRSFQFMLMPNLSESALRTSKREGAFYFCNEPGGSGTANVPRITSLNVDNASKKISVYANNYNSITWIGPGSQVVGTGNTFDFAAYPDRSFVRAELEGSRGTCYTQPFGIEAN